MHTILMILQTHQTRRFDIYDKHDKVESKAKGNKSTVNIYHNYCYLLVLFNSKAILFRIMWNKH